MIPTILLVHSPLVGPFTWQRVADELEGSVVVSPSVREVRDIRGPVVLVGHSGAGPLLPGIAARIEKVMGVVFVDAALPHPGEPALAHVPRPFVRELREMVGEDGMLPPWHEWFPPEALAAILPDESLRVALVSELRPIPFRVFTEPAPPEVWTGSAAYLLLSEGYRVHAEAAGEKGIPVVEQLDHHLATVTDPATVAHNLRQLIGAWDIVRE